MLEKTVTRIAFYLIFFVSLIARERDICNAEYQVVILSSINTINRVHMNTVVNGTLYHVIRNGFRLGTGNVFFFH